MTELEYERDALAKADRDIVEGEERITRQVALIARLRDRGHNVSQAETLLATLHDTLLAWRAHRVEIIRAIDRLESRAG